MARGKKKKAEVAPEPMMEPVVGVYPVEESDLEPVVGKEYESEPEIEDSQFEIFFVSVAVSFAL